MSSYDTGETYTPPSRSIRQSRSSMPEDTEPVVNNDYEPGAPILISLGGGLTPSRIVKKLPEEYEEKTLLEVVKYVISADNIQTNEETTIAEAIRDRMTMTDYRAIVNNRYNYHNDRLREDILKNYLIGDERQTEGGAVKFNKTDIAIVSHDEGGHYETLDKLV